MSDMRRCLLAVTFGGTLALSPCSSADVALAQGFPSRPVRVVTGSAPGSGGDTTARALALQLSRAWGQSVTVENRPGASQALAAGAVARAPADGYTLVFLTSSILATALQPNGPVNLERDLAPIRWVASGPLLLVVNSQLPVHDVNELISYARAQPQGLNFGSPGVGSSGHLIGGLLSDLTKVKISHVPYDGASQSAVGAASGEVDAAVAAFSAMSLVDAGKIRALAVSGKTRSPTHPEIPTIDETIQGATKVDWYGLFAPAGTPKPVLEQLYKDVGKAVGQPEVKTALTPLGLEIENADHEAFAKFIHADLEQYLRLAQLIGLKP